MHIAGPNLPGAKEARLTYRALEVLADATLLEIALETGRKHQIRLQLAHRGYPVVGDLKYGSRCKFPVGIALHARRLVFSHPIKGTPVTLESPLPGCWRGLGIEE
jgi:23S rRNA pseudouridine1911/1915/1917 synthase